MKFREMKIMIEVRDFLENMKIEFENELKVIF